MSNFKNSSNPKRKQLHLHLPLIPLNYLLMQPKNCLFHCGSGMHNTSSHNKQLHYAYHYTELTIHSEAKTILCNATHKHKARVQPFTLWYTLLICNSTGTYSTYVPQRSCYGCYGSTCSSTYVPRQSCCSRQLSLPHVQLHSTAQSRLQLLQ